MDPVRTAWEAVSTASGEHRVLRGILQAQQFTFFDRSAGEELIEDVERSLFMAEASENAGLVEGEYKGFGTDKTAGQLVKVEFEVGGVF
jgi:hypothetical protein